MADIAASTVSNLRYNVTGNTRVATGTVVTLATAASAEDTVFTGLTQVYTVSAWFATTAATSVHHLHGLTAFPSTVTAGGFVLKQLSTHNSFPVSFRAEGI